MAVSLTGMTRDHPTTADPEHEAHDVDYRDLLGTDRLAPIRLPSLADLATAARESRLLTAAHALAAWVGSSRPVDTDTGLPHADAETEVVRQLTAAGHLPDDTTAPRELRQLWELAEDLNFIDIGETEASEGEGLGEWRDGDDEAVLSVWSQGFAALSAWSLAIDAEYDGEPDLVFHGAGTSVLPLFSAREDGITLDGWNELVQESVELDTEPEVFGAAWSAWVERHGEPGAVFADRLERLGAVLPGESRITLTPLGSYVLWTEISEDVEVGLLPDPAAVTARELVAVTVLGTDAQAEQEWHPWRAARSAHQAARELAEVAATGTPAERATATVLLADLGPEVNDVWRELLDDPTLRPYAKQALGADHEASPEFALSDADTALLIADVFCDTDIDHPPPEIGELLEETVTPDDVEVFDAMWRLDHPGRADTLRLFGRHHPDKKVAKAARTAAFKAEGRR